MRKRSSLRWRASVAFVVSAVLISTLFAAATYLLGRDVELRFIEATIREELSHVVDWHERNPDAPIAGASNRQGYIIMRGDEHELPRHLRGLEPGLHESDHQGGRTYIAIEDLGGRRLYLTYDAAFLEPLEKLLGYMLVAGVIGFTLVALCVGYWLSGRIIAPVTTLTADIMRSRADVGHALIRTNYADDELRKLATDFNHYAERLRAFARREAAFTADMSHEMRNYLFVLRSTVELLSTEKSPDERRQERLDRLKRAIQQMEELTEVLLILAREPCSDDRSTANSSPIEPVLREVLARRSEDLKRRQLRPRIDVAAQLETTAPPIVVAAALSGLLDNTILHAHQGELVFTLEHGALTLHGSATDNSSGKSAGSLNAQRPHPQPAFEIDNLGLTIVRRLCERYHWSLEAPDSSVGRGSARLVFAP